MIRTEEEWHACSHPDELLQYLLKTDRISSRQARLFACACCRRIWSFLTDERSRYAVETAERYADGLATDPELTEAFVAAIQARPFAPRLRRHEPPCSAAAACAATEHEFVEDLYSPQDSFPFAERPLQLALAGAKTAAERARYVVNDTQVGRPRRRGGVYTREQGRAREVHENAERMAQCQLVREIMGNPFRPIRIDADWLAWNDSLVRRLAQQIHSGRAQDLYPILANALEDAGCTDEGMLAHCRQSEGHLRGCWLIDALLETESEFQPGSPSIPYAERAWLLFPDPRGMLEELFDRPWSKRKMRLFMVACCRALEHLLTEDRLRQTLDLIERYADGLASAEELRGAHDVAMPTDELLHEDLFRYKLACMVAAAAWADPAEGDLHDSSAWDVIQNAAEAVAMSSPWSADGLATDPEREAHAVQANLLREILGNVFRPVNLDPRWRVPAVSELARIIYEGREFHRLPELALLLEGAGCDNADVLEHCRSPGPHVRGCWAVDAVLGKS